MNRPFQNRPSPSRRSHFSSRGATPGSSPASADDNGQPIESNEPDESVELTLPRGGLKEAAPASLGDPAPAPAARNAPKASNVFQLKYTSGADQLAKPSRSPWLIGLASLALGIGIGYYAAHRNQPSKSSSSSAEIEPESPLNPALTSELQQETDAAFQTLKLGQFADARKAFANLLIKRPDWTRFRLEMARSALYARDPAGLSQILLDSANVSGITSADTQFFDALSDMSQKEFGDAARKLESAAAADPTRVDIYYYWGECLRRQGKPLEAIKKFRSAQLRNQYETAEGIYQLKLWLSEILADRETVTDSAKQIEADIASPYPSSQALLATAARAIKAGDFARAAEYLGKGRKTTDAVIFRVMLQDPIFFQEKWRPELKAFYAKPPAAQAASPAASPKPEVSPKPAASPKFETPPPLPPNP